jgi:hypothetical protein
VEDGERVRCKRAPAASGYGLGIACEAHCYGGAVRRGLAIFAALLAAATTASLAHADGDPASDVLPTDSVYFPINAPSQDAQSALTSAVDAVFANGNRVKVAVIATAEDLGAIPSLMNKPHDYAKFLGQELQGFYIGPLLIVMPNGWGVYDGGRTVSAESGVLNGMSVNTSSVDNLVRSATSAVQRLDSAGALKSPDIKPPWVYPQTVTLHPKRLVACPRKSRNAIRSSSEKKTGRRSLPREVTWYTAPGNSMRSGRAIVPRGSLGSVKTPRNLPRVERSRRRTPSNEHSSTL